jgi:hypothetical protein
MRKLSYLFSVLLLLTTSCDDGEVIDINLEFDKELELCTNGLNYVIYDLKENPYETLTLFIESNVTNDLIFNPATTPHSGTLNINGSSIRFNYRTYNNNPIGELLCVDIPSSTVKINEDYEAQGGTVEFTSDYEEVDGVTYLTVEFTINDLNLEILNSTTEYLGLYRVAL